MYKTSEIVAEYGITASLLKEYIIEQNIPLVNEEEISKKNFQTILSFIENTEDRIEKKLEKAEATFKYNSGKNKISIYQDDAISFLKKLPSNSVDVIATDPAYSGMNDKLKLGSGRIVGKYADKGKENGKWFGEFKDSEENYN
jgi:site-specific DNA-methyltransferase (adenine-specific)